MRLNQISPTWCRAFDQWARLNAHEREAIKFDMRLNTRCIVGEAYGWKDPYHNVCKECDYYAYSFMFVINGPDNILDKQLLDIKGREFSRHWFRCHVSKKEEKKKTKRTKR